MRGFCNIFNKNNINDGSNKYNIRKTSLYELMKEYPEIKCYYKTVTSSGGTSTSYTEILANTNTSVNISISTLIQYYIHFPEELFGKITNIISYQTACTISACSHQTANIEEELFGIYTISRPYSGSGTTFFPSAFGIWLLEEN